MDCFEYVTSRHVNFLCQRKFLHGHQKNEAKIQGNMENIS
jgi:hypothetical protein